jgi:hypothetical protein
MKYKRSKAAKKSGEEEIRGANKSVGDGYARCLPVSGRHLSAIRITIEPHSQLGPLSILGDEIMGRRAKASARAAGNQGRAPRNHLSGKVQA